MNSARKYAFINIIKSGTFVLNALCVAAAYQSLAMCSVCIIAAAGGTLLQFLLIYGGYQVQFLIFSAIIIACFVVIQV